MGCSHQGIYRRFGTIWEIIHGNFTTSVRAKRKSRADQGSLGRDSSLPQREGPGSSIEVSVATRLPSSELGGVHGRSVSWTDHSCRVQMGTRRLGGLRWI